MATQPAYRWGHIVIRLKLCLYPLYSKFRNFCEDFIFAKFRICEIS